MTARYTDFPKKGCPTISSPCWIPQADNIINDQIIRGLPQCDTIEKYSCMLHTLRQAVYENVEKQCIKSCKAESYDIITSDGTTNPWTTVRGHLSVLWSCFLIDFHTEGHDLVNLCHGGLPKLHWIIVHGGRNVWHQRCCGISWRVSWIVSWILMLWIWQKIDWPDSKFMISIIAWIL